MTDAATVSSLIVFNEPPYSKLEKFNSLFNFAAILL